MPMRDVKPGHLALLLLLASCGPTIQPLTPGGVPAPRNAPPPSAISDRLPVEPAIGVSGDGSRAAVAADSLAVVLPESLDVLIRTSMAEAAAAIGVSDSVLFADLPRLHVDSAAGEVADEVSWDIDVLSYATHERVSRYVTLFTGPARERIQAKLQRGKRYEPMIREKFRARGIPEDMYYLGLVESGYDPHAYSRAAAVGMWQFMSSTARGVGLRVDWWVDERRDPVKATDAAARFLNILHGQFGSYYLAAAAYNGGPGRVSRGLARFQDELQESVGDDKFFALAEQSYLRSETRNYVPQLIAAALIGKAPERYGLAITDSVERYAYDSVRVHELVSLGSVALASASTVEEIRDLNPHFLRGATPPRYNAWVRVPTGRAVGFDSVFEALSPEDRSGFTRVHSTKGQTLRTIAAAHGLDARRLAWYNPGLSPTKRLAVGREVLVPTAMVIAGSRDVPDPGIERYGSSSAGGRVVHVVRRGESLGSIARKYRTSVASLQRVNGLKRTVVYPGQSIIVRRSGSSRTRAAAVRRSSSSASAKAKGSATSRGKTPTKRSPTAGAAKKKTAAG